MSDPKIKDSSTKKLRISAREKAVLALDDVKKRTEEVLLKEKTIIPEKVGWVRKSWAWLNGKKSLFGIVSLIAGEFVPGTVGLIFKGVGTLLAPVGWVHSKLKSSNKTGEVGKFGIKELLQLIISVLESLIKNLKG